MVLCSRALSKVPSYLSSRGPEENAKLAEEVYQRLNAHKADNPGMGEVCMAPVLHHLQHFPWSVLSLLLLKTLEPTSPSAIAS